MSSSILARGTPVLRGALWLALSVHGLGCGDSTTSSGRLEPEIAAESTTTVPGDRAPVRIMPLGDSITQSDSEHDSYRRPLFHALTEARSGAPVDFVGSLSTNHRGAPPRPDFDLDHEGHWGWRVDEILERLPGWLETHRPDVLLVHLGSNDIFQREPNDETVRELSALVDTVLAAEPSATILVAKIISTTTPAANARILDFNVRLSGLETQYRGVVRLVDHHTGFVAERMTHDGVHPNEEGERHMAERWLEALEAALP